MNFTTYFTILVAFAMSTDAGTDKTLAPTDFVARPVPITPAPSTAPITPLPTEPLATPAPSTAPNPEPTPFPTSSSPTLSPSESPSTSEPTSGSTPTVGTYKTMVPTGPGRLRGSQDDGPI